VDPLIDKYPELSPYQFANNSPIAHVDLDGQEDLYYTLIWDENGKNPILKLAAIQKDLIPGFMASIYINGHYLGDKLTTAGAKEMAANYGSWDQKQFESLLQMKANADAEFEAKVKEKSEMWANAFALGRATQTPKGTYTGSVKNNITSSIDQQQLASNAKVTQTGAKQATSKPISPVNPQKTGIKPTEINFSQRTVSENVNQYIADMKAGNWDWNKSGPIRIMEMNGKYVTYDNRRLMAAQQANLNSIPFEIVKAKDIMPGSKKTWEQAFKNRFNDPRNLEAGGIVPAGGLSSQPKVIR
jgi:hypothetical protein